MAASKFNGTLALISMMRIWSLGLVLPALTLTAPAVLAQSPTLVSLAVSSTPDEQGVYSFDVEPGDVVSTTVQTSPDDPSPSCFPEFIGGPSPDLTIVGYITQTPYSDSAVMQFTAQNAGHYRYQVVPTRRLESVFGEEEPEPVLPSDDPAEGHWCRVTVQPASSAEQLWAIANRLYDQREDLEQALDLYRQVIATEPGYPEPYERYFHLLIGLNIGDLSATSADDPAVAAWFMDLPDSVQQAILETSEQLAQLYEANPTWQLKPEDDPDFWRGYATYLQTGVAPEVVSDVLFP